MKRHISLVLAFALTASACGSDNEPAKNAIGFPDPAAEAVVTDETEVFETAANSDLPDDSVLMAAGWTLGDDGLLHPPPIDWVDGYGPEDQSLNITFRNNSSYNLDLHVAVTNDEGSDQNFAALDRDSSAFLSIPATDDTSFAFFLTQPGQSTTYEFAGDRGGAPCGDKLSALEPGSSWEIDFRPTDGGTFGFPGTMTDNDGTLCTFGMLTTVQSFVIEHPVLAAVAVVIAAAVIVVTGFKIVRARAARARVAGAIVEASRAERLAPKIVTLDTETIRLEMELREVLEGEKAARMESGLADLQRMKGQLTLSAEEYLEVRGYGFEIDPVTGRGRFYSKHVSPNGVTKNPDFVIKFDEATGKDQWFHVNGYRFDPFEGALDKFASPLEYQKSELMLANRETEFMELLKSGTGVTMLMEADLEFGDAFSKFVIGRYNGLQLAELDATNVMAADFARIRQRLAEIDLRLGEEIPASTRARLQNESDALSTREATYGKLLKQNGFVAETPTLTPEFIEESVIAWSNNRRLPQIASQYAELDGAVYETVMRKIGDEVTIRALTDATFGPVEWEEAYLAAREAVQATAVG